MLKWASIPIVLGATYLAGCKDFDLLSTADPKNGPEFGEANSSLAKTAQQRPDPVPIYLSLVEPQRQRLADYTRRFASTQSLHGNIELLNRAGAYTRKDPRVRPFFVERRAQHLLVQGFTPDRIRSLQNRGVDVAAAAAAGVYATLMQHAAVSEFIVVGEPVSKQDDTTPGDGYGSSLTFQVVEVLKGTPPSNRAPTGIWTAPQWTVS
jgi:hypothetical protein